MDQPRFDNFRNITAINLSHCREGGLKTQRNLEIGQSEDSGVGLGRRVVF